MKKASRRASEDLRPVYKRSDFGSLVRGKYAQRVIEATNVVVLDPKIAKAFPNDRAVNKALRGLLRDRKLSARTTPSTRRVVSGGPLRPARVSEGRLEHRGPDRLGAQLLRCRR